MRNPIELLRHSSFRFLAYRSLQVIWQKAQNAYYGIALSGALGECGYHTRIDHGVTLVLPKNIYLGNNCYLASGCMFTTESDQGDVHIGDNAVIAANVRIDYSGGVTIGKDLLISEGVKIYTHDHSPLDFKITKSSPLTIGDHVWLGANSIILPAVESIGSGSVIGAGSVVTKSIPERVVVGGNPANVISVLEEVNSE